MKQVKKIRVHPKHREWDEAITRAGVAKAERGSLHLFLLGILGGLYISFGGHLFLAVLSGGGSRIVASFLFSVGLILVVIAGAELFTGNILMITGLLRRRFGPGRLLKNWALVYLGNALGSVAYAIVVWESGLFGHVGSASALGNTAIAVAEAKVLLPLGEAFIRAVLCNILVVLAIIMSFSTRDYAARVISCILPVGTFVALGFEHCVANMFLIPIGYLSAGTPLAEWGAIIPGILIVSLGNIIGGVFIVMIHPDRIRQLKLKYD